MVLEEAEELEKTDEAGDDGLEGDDGILNASLSAVDADSDW
jgi:hypothetical protein